MKVVNFRWMSLYLLQTSEFRVCGLAINNLVAGARNSAAAAEPPSPSPQCQAEVGVVMACLSSTPSSFCCRHSTLPRRLQSVGLRSSCHSWSAVQSKGLVASGHGEGSAAVSKKAFRVLCSQATSEASNHSEEPSERATGLAALEQFIELNVGSWSGAFTVRADAPSVAESRKRQILILVSEVVT
jgi:hypothetical protein